MLKALRNFSLGAEALEIGQTVPAAALEPLPAGRVETLKAHRYVAEASDEQAIEEAIGDLAKRVEKLERKLNSQPKRQRRAA